MVRFYGNNRISITDRLTSHNTIFILLKEFERFFKNNTKLGFIVNEFERVDRNFTMMKDFLELF